MRMGCAPQRDRPSPDALANGKQSPLCDMKPHRGDCIIPSWIILFPFLDSFKPEVYTVFHRDSLQDDISRPIGKLHKVNEARSRIDELRGPGHQLVLLFPL